MSSPTRDADTSFLKCISIDTLPKVYSTQRTINFRLSHLQNPALKTTFYNWETLPKLLPVHKNNNLHNMESLEPSNSNFQSIMMHTADRSVERSVETIFTLMDATDLSGEQDVDMMHNLPHRQLDTVRHRRNRRKPGTNSVYHHEGGHNKIDETQDWSVLDDFADEADPEGHCAVRGDAATQGI